MCDSTDATRLAIAQVTARLSDFQQESDNLSSRTFSDLVAGPGSGGTDGAWRLALGLLNLSMFLVLDLSRATGAPPEELLQAVARRLHQIDGDE